MAETVIGADRFVADLAVLRRDLSSIVAPDGLRAVAGAAASTAPRRTGRLAASIRADTAAGAVVVEAPYGGVVHAGWPAHGMRANPFLVRGAQAASGQLTGAYETAVQAAADRVRGA